MAIFHYVSTSQTIFHIGDFGACKKSLANEHKYSLNFSADYCFQLCIESCNKTVN